MKKILSLILTLFCVLSLVGCGRSMDDIIKNESSITGVVEEVYNNSILISIQTDAYPYGAYCDVSLDAENKDDMVDFNIGDEVIVYYDGNIAESGCHRLENCRGSIRANPRHTLFPSG